MRRFLNRLKARLSPVLQSDTAFIEAAFVEILGRRADLDGLNHYRRVLRDGLGRTAVLLDIMRSEESRAKLQPPPSSSLPDLRRLRPERYAEAIDRTNGDMIPVFEAETATDVDWLERAIIDYGYYEKPGVWVLDVDADKRVVAEIIAAFGPARALELGCAAGAVLQCLLDYGVVAEGVEISAMAIARAPENVRARIHHGDLLSLELAAGPAGNRPATISSSAWTSSSTSIPTVSTPTSCGWPGFWTTGDSCSATFRRSAKTRCSGRCSRSTSIAGGTMPPPDGRFRRSTSTSSAIRFTAI